MTHSWSLGFQGGEKIPLPQPVSCGLGPSKRVWIKWRKVAFAAHSERERGVKVVLPWRFSACDISRGRSTQPPLYYRPLYNFDTSGPGALAVLLMVAGTNAEVAGTAAHTHAHQLQQCRRSNASSVHAAGTQSPTVSSDVWQSQRRPVGVVSPVIWGLA